MEGGGGGSVWEAGVVVFVILYYSSFIFYFDVVCESVFVFRSHREASGVEEAEQETVERSDDLSWTRTSTSPQPRWRRRSTLRFYQRDTQH